MNAKIISAASVSLLIAVSLTGCLDQEEAPAIIHPVGTAVSVDGLIMNITDIRKGHLLNVWGGYYDYETLAINYTITNNSTSTVAIDRLAESTLVDDASNSYKSNVVWMFDEGHTGNVSAGETVYYVEYFDDFNPDATKYTLHVKKAKFISDASEGEILFSFNMGDVRQDDAWEYLESIKIHQLGEIVTLKGVEIMLENASIEDHDVGYGSVRYLVLALNITNTNSYEIQYSPSYAVYGNEVTDDDNQTIEATYVDPAVDKNRSYTNSSIQPNQTIHTALFFRLYGSSLNSTFFTVQLNSQLVNLGVSVQFRFSV